jgi:hypothetical protein
MNRNKHDNNIIEINETITKTETKPGTVWGKTEKVTRETRQIGYFCYVKYNVVMPEQTCDTCLMTINRPVPMRVGQPINPELMSELKGNDLFQKLQKNAEENRLDLDDSEEEYSLESE